MIFKRFSILSAVSSNPLIARFFAMYKNAPLKLQTESPLEKSEVYGTWSILKLRNAFHPMLGFQAYEFQFEFQITKALAMFKTIEIGAMPTRIANV